MIAVRSLVRGSFASRVVMLKVTQLITAIERKLKNIKWSLWGEILSKFSLTGWTSSALIIRPRTAFFARTILSFSIDSHYIFAFLIVTRVDCDLCQSLTKTRAQRNWAACFSIDVNVNEVTMCRCGDRIIHEEADFVTHRSIPNFCHSNTADDFIRESDR